MKFDTPEIYDVSDSSLSLRWNTVDVPAFTHSDEPLTFVIERQTLPGYEWEPIASDIMDRSYTISDLQPYQDYNFRIRGVYASGYTEPSPHVPVYRRPSESKLGLLDPRYRVKQAEPSPRFASEPPVSKPGSIPAIYIRKPRVVEDLALDRRYSVPNLFAPQTIPEIDPRTQRKTSVPEPGFKREQAYVYRRSRSPTKRSEISERFVSYYQTQVPEPKKKPQKGYDLYEWYLRQRRYSDVGLEELRRMRSRGVDMLHDGRRMELIEESKRKFRKPSLSTIPQRKMLEIMEGTNKDPSVADRIEDIKTPYIVEQGHWAFPRRHSVAVDKNDLARIKILQQQVLRAKAVEKAKQAHKPRDLAPIPKSPEEYFQGVPFRVEDEVKFNAAKPTFKARPVTKPRSMSVDLQPGYFVVSKFSVAVTGVKRVAPRAPVIRETRSAVRAEGRSASPDYRRWAQTRSLTPDIGELRRMTRSYTPEIPDLSDIKNSLKHRSLMAQQEIERSRIYDRRPSFARYSRERSLGPSSPSRYASPSPAGRSYIPSSGFSTPSRSQSYVKPRSYSISVPPSEGRFNKTVEDSKTLISKYTTLQQKSTDQLSRASSVARTPGPTKIRSMSIADLRSDRRYSTSRRGSSVATSVMADPRYTTQSRGSLSVSSDVRRDSRFSVTPRGSNVSLRPPSSDLKSDPRYTSQPRLSVSHAEQQMARRKSSVASTTNEDLKSKLDSAASKLAAHTPKPKKSRPVMKFKSSKGEGALYEG